MKINKILLMTTPVLTFKSHIDVNPLPPMGLGYLASVVESMGCGIDVRIVDCLVQGWSVRQPVSQDLIRIGLSDLEIETIISDYNPDIVGINCQFSRQHKIYHQMFSLIKKIKPECITVAGGAHVTVCPQEVLQDRFCDFIIVGEAEESFRSFLDALMSGDDFTLIDGLGWKRNGKLIFNEKKKWIADLDTIPFPAYHVMRLENYFGLDMSHGLRRKKKFSPIITSRGCSAKCTFCSAHRVWGNKHRKRSVENVIKEMRLLRDTYGIEELMFEDDNVTADPKRAKELFSRMITENFDFQWSTPNGVGAWTLTPDTLDLMKKSGCVRMNFPVESGSQRVLREIIKKPLNLSKIRQLVDHCKIIDLEYGMFLIVGMPGETLEDIRNSFRFAAECECYDPLVSIATPYPGTELFEMCLEQSLFSKEFELDDLFITSYMLKTQSWDEKKLRDAVKAGFYYLQFKKLMGNPKKFVLSLARILRRPSSIPTHIKDMILLTKEIFLVRTKSKKHLGS